MGSKVITMKLKTTILALLFALPLCLAGCGGIPAETESTEAPSSRPAETEMSAAASADPEPTVEEETSEETTAETEPEAVHSPLYIDGVDVEDVIRYFNEVCLDAEYVSGGDPSLLQKWADPIYYTVNGSPTNEDLEILGSFTAWLNTIEGFPGIQEAKDPGEANLQIHFCTSEDMLALMGDSFTNMDGAVTYWYDEDVIYSAIICYRTDLHQSLRSSVILEEIYNGLGPIQDTQLRPDSIISDAYSEQQALSQVDELILKLLYHPLMQCGMDAGQCETVIRQLYY